MAIELATGYVSIVPSAKGFGSKLSSEIGGDLDSVGTDAGDRVSKGFMSKFSGTGVKIAATLGAAFASAKIADGLSGAVSGASDLNETVSKVGVIFGSSAGVVENFAATADKGLGQSKKQALDAAATFATFGKSAGLSGDSLAGFSTGLVGLSADFASFFNTSPADAIESIGAALRGESEPIRKYGILLDEATLRNRALQLGLISTTKDALTPQQRVLAAQAEIYAQSADAQGDFARTSEGAANKQRILSAEAANASATLGQALLPAYTAFVTLMAERVLPALTSLTTFLTEHKGVALALGIVIGTIVVVAFVAWAAAAIAAAVATLAAIAPILLIAAAVAGFIAVMIILPLIVGRNLGAILGFFADVFGKIGEFFKALPGQIISFLGDAASWLLQTGINALTGFFNGVVAVWPLVVAFFLGLPGAILGFIGNLLSLLFSTGVDLLQGLINGILSLVGAVVNFFVQLPGNILGWIGNLAALLFDTGSNILQGLINGIQSLVGVVVNFFSQLPGNILGWIGNVAALLLGTGRDILQGLINGFTGLVGQVSSFFSNLPGQIVGWLGSLGSLLVGAGGDVISGFINGITSWLPSIAGNISGIPGKITSALGSLGSLLVGAGEDVIQGLINGIKSMAGAAADAARSAVSSAVNAAKSALGIGSPSKVFAAIGVNVGEGFVLGVQKTSGMVDGAVSNLLSVGPQRFSTAPNLSVSSASTAASGAIGGGSPTINIHAQTNANPQQISRELSWVLLTRGR